MFRLAAGLSLPPVVLRYWGCRGEENDRLSMTFCCRPVLFSNPAANPSCLVPQLLFPCLLPPDLLLDLTGSQDLLFGHPFFPKAFRKTVTHPVQDTCTLQAGEV